MELAIAIIEGTLAELPISCLETMTLDIAALGGSLIFNGPLSVVCPETLPCSIPLTCACEIGKCSVLPLLACAWAGIKGVIGGTAGVLTNQLTNILCGK